jgi:serine/threonine protein kinase
MGGSGPQRIGPYRIEGRLGEGGMGEVFLAASPGGRKVAIKIIRPEYAADPRFRHRFAREVAAARRVAGLHTAQVVDADPDAAAPWLATEFIPGPTLRHLVATGQTFTGAGLRGLAAGLAEGLGEIHAGGVVHRDLTPGNIILAADAPRIVDFGVAQEPDTGRTTAHGETTGT